MVNGLLNETAHLDRKLFVFFSLFSCCQLFLRWLWLFRLLVRKVLQKRAFTDFVPIIIDNIAVVVDLFSDEILQVSFCQLSDKVSIFVSNLPFFVDLPS